MQIDLIPKTRDIAKKMKRTRFLLVSFSVLLLAAAGLLTMALYSVNFVKGNTIKNLDKEISLTKKELSKYSQLERNIEATSSGLESIKEILSSQDDWTKLYKEIETLMPKETVLTETSASRSEVTFKTKTADIKKVAEFIFSLKNHKIKVGKGDSTLEVNLFSDIGVSNFSKETKNSTTYYMFDVNAKISEEIWQAS